MTFDLNPLLAAAKSAVEWGQTVDAMKAIQAAAADPAIDMEPLAPELILRLDDIDEWVAQEAAKTLGAMGSASAIRPLCGLLGGPPVQLPTDLGPKPGEAAYALAMVAADNDNLRVAAIGALQAIGNAAAIPTLLALAADLTHIEAVRKAAADAAMELAPN